MTFDFNMLSLFMKDINRDNLNVTSMVKVDWSDKRNGHTKRNQESLGPVW